MSLDGNLTAARNAVAYVKGLGIKAANKISDRIEAAGGVDSVIGTDQGSRMGVLGPAGNRVSNVRASGLQDYRDKVAYYIAQRAGNCQEQAEIALLHMYDAGIRPLDLMFFSAVGYDHVWVGVGLHAGWESGNLRSWGADAVWCDPWQGDGMAFSISDLVKGKVRNLNSKYKCDSLERIEEGLPKSTNRYT